jgi:serine/threonine kinase PknH
VLILVLGGLGAWWAFKGDDSSVQATSTSTSTKARAPITSAAPRTTAIDPNSPDSKLLGLLPADYDEGICKPVHPPAPGALATVDCGKTNSPGGPAVTRYSLFPDQATLDANFKDAIAQNSELVKCPGSDLDSPTAWNYNDNTDPDQKAGQVACGTFEGNPDVTWTKDADLVLADAQGPNLDELHQWWNEEG